MNKNQIRGIRSRTSGLLIAKSISIKSAGRFLLRGVMGAQAEMSLATLADNLKRMLKLLGAVALRAALAA